MLAELGWMAMTTVDTIMVGHLGPAAIGAIGVGSSIYYAVAVFGMGLLLGLDTLVSQAHGAGNRPETHRWLTQGVWLALFISIPLTIVFAFVSPIFLFFGINRQVSELAGPFVSTLGLGTLPLLFYGGLRRYLQGIGRVRPVMFALVSANLVNWLVNWLLIDGHWGLPRLGVVGSALSTCFARCYMSGMLLFFVWWFERGQGPGFRSLFRRPEVERLKRLFQLGFPAALQIGLEISAFGAAAVLAGQLAPEALAAHQIALNTAALSFMVPLGISSAAAVAVGQAIGRGQPVEARHNGYIAIGLACAFMICAAAVFLTIPRQILGIYSKDPNVLNLGVSLLAVAAAFQLFDGVQATTTGALRGAGNTRTPMFANLCGYWLFGLPIGYVLCFHFGYGVIGLWWGLTLALMAISIVLLLTWRNVRI